MTQQQASEEAAGWTSWPLGSGDIVDSRDVECICDVNDLDGLLGVEVLFVQATAGPLRFPRTSAPTAPFRWHYYEDDDIFALQLLPENRSDRQPKSVARFSLDESGLVTRVAVRWPAGLR